MEAREFMTGLIKQQVTELKNVNHKDLSLISLENIYITLRWFKSSCDRNDTALFSLPTFR